MRTTPERQGRPDRSNAGPARNRDRAPRDVDTRRPGNPRRGQPDRNRSGSSRDINRRAALRNDMQRQLAITDPGIDMARAGDVAGQRTLLEFTTSGTNMVKAADVAAQRTLLEFTTSGTNMVKAADVAAQRTLLEFTTPGTNMVKAADVAAQRTLLELSLDTLGKGASLIAIHDAATDFVATDVEAALAELHSDTESAAAAAATPDNDKLDKDGSSAMTGGLTINSSDGLTVVGAAPQIKISDSSTDEATKKGFITLAHDDNAEEDFCIVYARSQDLVAKLSIGGGDSSVNAASAVSIYVADNGDTVSGTELVRWKTSGMRIGGTGNPTATCILDLGSVTGQTFLPPKGTTSQRDAISQETGSIYYNTTTNKLQCHNGTSWQDCF
jgi:hypothetical protein